MTPVISGSRSMKGELLFHILEHDGFVSVGTQRKYTEGSALRTDSQEKTQGRLLVWVCVHLDTCV